MNMKLFTGLNEKLMELLQQQEDLYFEERPFLEHPRLPQKRVLTDFVHGINKTIVEYVPAPRTIIYKEAERKQIQMEIEAVSKELDYLLKPVQPIEDNVILELFGPISG